MHDRPFTQGTCESPGAADLGCVPESLPELAQRVFRRAIAAKHLGDRATKLRSVLATEGRVPEVLNVVTDSDSELEGCDPGIAEGAIRGATEQEALNLRRDAATPIRTLRRTTAHGHFGCVQPHGTNRYAPDCNKAASEKLSCCRMRGN